MIEYNCLELRMPVVSVEYEEKLPYTYRRGRGHENLKKALLQASSGYCMYCYMKVQVDGKVLAQLEHAVEKELSDKLSDCVPNIGLACSKCNGSFKKVGQLHKKDVDDRILADFNEAVCHDPSHCHQPCQAYIDVRKHCIDRHPLILQPPLSVGLEQEFGIAYNVLKGRFQPISSDARAQSVVWAHIRQFNLNDEYYRTRELLRYCRDVVETNVVQRHKGCYNNRVVDVFIDYMEDCPDADIINLCKIICALNAISPQGEVIR